MLGQETDVAASYARVAMKIVTGDDMPGIAQELKDTVNKIICLTGCRHSLIARFSCPLETPANPLSSDNLERAR
jgi:hypothetical protein